MKPIFTKQNSKFTPYWNYSIENEYKESIARIKKYLDIPLEEHIQRHISWVQKYNQPLNLEKIRENQENNYRENGKIFSASLEEYYNAFLCEICHITGNKIPYDTDYYVQVIRDDKHDPDYLVYSLEGLKIMAEQINSLTNW